MSPVTRDLSSPTATDDQDLSGRLAQAIQLWRAGQWQLLDGGEFKVDENAEGASIAAGVMGLRALAAIQLGHHAEARRRTVLALSMGCSRDWLARAALSDAFQTLASCAALCGDYEGFELRMAQSAETRSDPRDEESMLLQSMRELRRLGLLVNAPVVLKKKLERLQDKTVDLPELHAQIKMLKTEMELLEHELVLAQTRGQLDTKSQNQVGAESDLAQIQKHATSQLGQDLWVLEKTGHKRGGYFVEFGATNGVLLSNTYLLEKEFGWTGICAEPNPKFFSQLQQQRSCIATSACVGPRTGDRIQFVLAAEYGGMMDQMANDRHADKRQAYAVDPANVITLETVSLDDLLLRNGAPRDIDYLSVDTEGSEYDILSTFPFDRWRIRLITVEHNFSPLREPLRELLERHGYRRTEAKWDDWYELI